jgi:carbon-monoxide dehydrogenase small subunit
VSTLTFHAVVNGRAVAAAIDSRQTLLDVLRDTLGLTGTKRGCEVGECGACTVLLDGVAVNSCLVLAAQAEGRRIVTVEGLAAGETLVPLQEAFLEHDAVHCGFCTPGMLLSAQDLLDHHPSPTEEDIRVAIAGNLCRCSGYVQIVEAIQDAAGRRTARREIPGRK